MGLGFDRQALVSIFTAEASDGLDKLWAVVNHSEPHSFPGPDVVHQLFIIAHSLKGSSALYGYETPSALAGILEKAIEQVHEAPAAGMAEPRPSGKRDCRTSAAPDRGDSTNRRPRPKRPGWPG